MRDKIGYLLRAVDKLSGPGLAIGDQYYCPDTGSCVWMLCKEQTRDGVAPVLVVGGDGEMRRTGKLVRRVPGGSEHQ